MVSTLLAISLHGDASWKGPRLLCYTHMPFPTPATCHLGTTRPNACLPWGSRKETPRSLHSLCTRVPQNQDMHFPKKWGNWSTHIGTMCECLIAINHPQTLRLAWEVIGLVWIALQNLVMAQSHGLVLGETWQRRREWVPLHPTALHPTHDSTVCKYIAYCFTPGQIKPYPWDA